MPPDTELRNRNLLRLRWQLEGTLAGRSRIEYLWKAQGGRCPVCQQALLATEKPWHLHHRHWRSLGGSDTVENLQLLYPRRRRTGVYNRPQRRIRK